MLLVPHLQIRANSIYSFVVNEDRNYSGRSIQSLLTQNLLETPTYTGTLRPGSKKRLIKAIEFMVMSTPKREIFNPVSHQKQPFQLGFLTLTIHSTDRNITGKEAHKTCLEPFIKWMRQNYDIRSYIWKAELQKRGQIHYHLTIDNFIHYKAIRTKWNELQQRAGYLEMFYRKKGHYNPNSIDIHSTKKVQNMSGYLVKEIAKSFQTDKSIGGKIWDCSMNLKTCKYFTVHENLDYSYINHMVASKQMRVIETDHCYIYETTGAAFNILSEGNLKLYNQHMEMVRSGVVPEKIKPINELPEIKMIPLTVIDQQKDLFYRDIPIEFDIDIGVFSSS